MESKAQNQTETSVDLMQKPVVDSDRFFKLVDSSVQGLRECKLIAAAFELGVFEALKVPLSAGVLAKKLGCDPVLMPHFCESLHSLGFLDRFEEGAHEEEENAQMKEKSEGESEDGSEGKNPDPGKQNSGAVYLVSELSATYLLENSPFSQQHYLADRLRNVELWVRLPQIMKSGPEIVEKGPFFGEVVQCMAENARCGLLQETVRVVQENVDFTNVKKLLDLGGGHGLYAIAFAKLNENLQAFVFDLPPVTQKTKDFIEKYGASRVDIIPGDFFNDEIGGGYDVIFSSFNPGGKVPSLIPKISEALTPGGVFVTRQVQDEKMKSSPLLSLDWNLWTFEDVKKGGSGYSFENSVPFTEYIEMLGSYGLEVFRALDMKDGSRIVFAWKID
ncbi:SAM-dependent methlyltransferase [Methanosarcina sp. 2.H.T.1A.6]|uniref:methyltransferase n=1 Tax=unclassified Methanosarcina TaxID=2644672 RepID=UPI000621975A|nr:MULTISPECIES: methyltransferase [unclassified Methanosarcina]KKG17013.1 SAM-dependent methlyltransferase [Methanosarcina sp. 2.H.T.1A.3]KKG20363.1 SAM-dependent methlyltransferase [Methanosarcina sp. 2.H.T.1A.6]KKG23372.1 SAM-dependent methlyltransferase [Methanosarcina sp. 2.H.T.1A.8]KKG26832.1 SAM-dependent methlyltransferase [Methanosarcina sp. 2.H.T.1A.15]